MDPVSEIPSDWWQQVSLCIDLLPEQQARVTAGLDVFFRGMEIVMGQRIKLQAKLTRAVRRMQEPDGGHHQEGGAPATSQSWSAPAGGGGFFGDQRWQPPAIVMEHHRLLSALRANMVGGRGGKTTLCTWLRRQ